MARKALPRDDAVGLVPASEAVASGRERLLEAAQQPADRADDVEAEALPVSSAQHDRRAHLCRACLGPRCLHEPDPRPFGSRAQRRRKVEARSATRDVHRAAALGAPVDRRFGVARRQAEKETEAFPRPGIKGGPLVLHALRTGLRCLAAHGQSRRGRVAPARTRLGPCGAARAGLERQRAPSTRRSRLAPPWRPPRPWSWARPRAPPPPPR